jgi:ferredoxin-NADP reductase
MDIRLTAEDGYRAERSYSISSAPDGERVEVTVQKVDDGEVSPYLVDVVEPGDRFEVRGPIGGYFVYPPRGGDDRPVQLFGGGSGVAPLMAMVRERSRIGATAPMRLVYSVRDPEQVIFADELAKRAEGGGLDLVTVYTRHAPEGWTRPIGRLDATTIGEATRPPSDAPACYVCGPTAFVEAVAATLVDLGHPARSIWTERFG